MGWADRRRRLPALPRLVLIRGACNPPGAYAPDTLQAAVGQHLTQAGTADHGWGLRRSTACQRPTDPVSSASLTALVGRTGAVWRNDIAGGGAPTQLILADWRGWFGGPPCWDGERLKGGSCRAGRPQRNVGCAMRYSMKRS